MINNILFQDITAEGAASALGIFYIIGQLFIKSLQLVIVPMVFTSIALAIGQISDTRTLGRISFKTIGWFLLCSFFALVLACLVGITCYNMGIFTAQVEGLSGAAGSTGANPLNVVLNVVPANITQAFSNNTAVLSIVFLAVAVGLCINTLGEEKTATLKKLIMEVNDVVVVFLNYVCQFCPAYQNVCQLWNQLLETGTGVRGRDDNSTVYFPAGGVSACRRGRCEAEPDGIHQKDHKRGRLRLLDFFECRYAAAKPEDLHRGLRRGFNDCVLCPSARHDDQHERNGYYAGHRDRIHRRLRRL